MIKIKIYSVGKTHEPWLEEGLDMYATRLSPWAQIEFIWLKDLAHLEKALQNEKNIILLDPIGHQMDSLGFADWFYKEVERLGSRISFVIGPAEGLPEAMKKQGKLISLSRMTFTHQLTRLILIEQIFRAFEIMKGSQYHK